MLANKLKPILEYIIDEDQKGFLSNRRISCNIRRILDLVEVAEQENMPYTVVSIDFLKCFDRIEISALLSSIDYFNLGAHFRRWTEIAYKNPVACVVNNGHLSNYMKVGRGVKQGGPCSAYYFLLIAEVLAIELRKDPEIKGVQIDNIIKLLAQYADNIDLYLLGEEQNLQKAFNVIEIFCKCTGFKINYDKMTVHRIGSLRKTQAKFYTKNDVKWENYCINVLGVDVIQGNEINDVNYTKLIKKTQSILMPWSKRHLSLIGRKLVINTLIASLYVYKMSVLPIMSNEMINKLHQIIKLFLWEGKKAKIQLKTLQAPKELGGLAVVDFRIKDLALKAAWVSIVRSDSMLQKTAYLALSSVLQSDIWHCNISRRDVK